MLTFFSLSLVQTKSHFSSLAKKFYRRFFFFNSDQGEWMDGLSKFLVFFWIKISC